MERIGRQEGGYYKGEDLLQHDYLSSLEKYSQFKISIFLS